MLAAFGLECQTNVTGKEKWIFLHFCMFEAHSSELFGWTMLSWETHPWRFLSVFSWKNICANGTCLLPEQKSPLGISKWCWTRGVWQTQPPKDYIGTWRHGLVSCGKKTWYRPWNRYCMDSCVLIKLVIWKVWDRDVQCWVTACISVYTFREPLQTGGNKCWDVFISAFDFFINKKILKAPAL